jgi:tRNA (cmo5U34)-methyltransferase
MTDISSVAMFEQHAGEYEGLRRRLVPSFDAFYGGAVGALALSERPLRRVLDLGAGTGVLSRAVAAQHPEAELVLLDGSAAMLDRARRALPATARFVLARLEDQLPDGPWDAVISALAIHHLEHDAKQQLFARCHEALLPGGVFIDADQVLGPTPALDAFYRDWHRRRAHELGASAEEWQGALERMRADRLASVEDQLGWLRRAGFAEVDCVFKDHCVAVLAARRTG